MKLLEACSVMALNGLVEVRIEETPDGMLLIKVEGLREKVQMALKATEHGVEYVPVDKMVRAVVELKESVDTPAPQPGPRYPDEDNRSSEGQRQALLEETTNFLRDHQEQLKTQPEVTVSRRGLGPIIGECAGVYFGLQELHVLEKGSSMPTEIPFKDILCVQIKDDEIPF